MITVKANVECVMSVRDSVRTAHDPVRAGLLFRDGDGLFVMRQRAVEMSRVAKRAVKRSLRAISSAQSSASSTLPLPHYDWPLLAAH